MSSDVQLIFGGNIELANKDKNKFKDMVSSLEPEDLDDLYVKKRNQIVIELYHTEVSYLLQLELLIHYFIHPLLSNQIMPNTSFDLIFGNIVQLYNINKELLLTIKTNPQNISHAFTTFAPYLKLYSIYAYGYKKALGTLEELQKKNKKLNELVRRQQTRPEVGSTLISLLISPIQRIPRYRLLLQSLLQCSPPFTQIYLETQDALSKVEETAEHINRLVTEAEEGEAMVLLARRLGVQGPNLVVPGRKILKEGVVRKTAKNGSGSQQRYLVLFTDALLLCKGGAKGFLTMGHLLPLRLVAIEPVLGSSVFKVTCEGDDILLYTGFAEEGAVWVQAIRDAIRNHLECRRTLRKDNSKRTMRQRPLANFARTAAAIVQRARRACRKDGKPTCVTKLKRLVQKSRKV